MMRFQEENGCYNSNSDCNQTIKQFGVEGQLLVLKECENSHTLRTTTTGSKCSQKEANNQTDYQSHNALGPPKVPSLQALGLSQGQVQDTHSAINKLK